MNKNRELAKNTVIFGIGTFGAKFMQFILIPLYTLHMTTSDYSTSDIVMSTVTMLLPFLTLGMGHGILRFVIGKKRNERPLIVFSLIVCLISTGILFIAIPLLRMTAVFGGYEYMIPVLFLVGSLKTVLSNYCKAIDKNMAYAINGIISAFNTAFFSILLIRILHIGVRGYLWAYLISYAISDLHFILVCHVPDTIIRSENRYGSTIIKETLRYSVPLMPNDLAWWIIQMSDRYMVTWICGAAINGIYTMAYKIPGIFNILVSIFIQAFSITVFKECDLNTTTGKYNGRYFQKVYENYLAISFGVVVVVMLATKPVAAAFIRNDFFDSWYYTPFLLIAFMIGNLEAFLGSILGGIKKTNISFVSTALAAMINVTLNALLIPKYKVYGAIIATDLAYFCVYFIRFLGVSRYVEMDMHNLKSVFSILIILFMALSYVNNEPTIRFFSIFFGLCIICLYGREYLNMMKTVISKTKSIEKG